MQTPTRRWQVPPLISPEAAQALSEYPPILRQLLFNRGIQNAETAQVFLEALSPAGTDPWRMKGIPEAVARIQRAIQDAESIVVYGDYDVDGVTATALLTQVIGQLGGRVSGYIPNRFDEGYGLNIEALETLHSAGAALVITVDCGIRSPAEAEFARSIGLDLVITDHHHPAPEIPPAVAVINPKQPDCQYPEKDLAGVGLAYKLACALCETSAVPSGQDSPAAKTLDLVALGTVADMAPLLGENRFLVRAGIEVIHAQSRQGIVSLAGAAGITPKLVTSADIGFMLGPRLNAAGRLDSAWSALKLLTTTDVAEAGRISQELNNQNRERQELTQKIQEQAYQIALERDPQALLLFAADPSFNPGIVGLAASRLSERFYRPAIVAHIAGDFTRGSCRSIPEYHITQALDTCSDLLVKYGGHSAAAGFTVETDQLETFITRLQAHAHQSLSSLELQPTLKADMVLPLSHLKPDTLKHLKLLQPTGVGNAQPAFISEELRVVSKRPVGRENAHLKLTVSDGKITYDAIAFRMGAYASSLPERIDLLFNFETNEYNGVTTIQLNVRDMRPARSTLAA